MDISCNAEQIIAKMEQQGSCMAGKLDEENSDKITSLSEHVGCCTDQYFIILFSVFISQSVNQRRLASGTDDGYYFLMHNLIPIYYDARVKRSKSTSAGIIVGAFDPNIILYKKESSIMLNSLTSLQINPLQ